MVSIFTHTFYNKKSPLVKKKVNGRLKMIKKNTERAKLLRFAVTV
jgi:hypothetical protein